MKDLSQLRVALVHYWLVRRRGGERVLEALAEMLPEADIFTLVLDRKSLKDSLRSHRITTSFLQRLPGAVRRAESVVVIPGRPKAGPGIHYGESACGWIPGSLLRSAPE